MIIVLNKWMRRVILAVSVAGVVIYGLIGSSEPSEAEEWKAGCFIFGVPNSLSDDLFEDFVEHGIQYAFFYGPPSSPFERIYERYGLFSIVYVEGLHQELFNVGKGGIIDLSENKEVRLKQLRDWVKKGRGTPGLVGYSLHDEIVLPHHQVNRWPEKSKELFQKETGFKVPERFDPRLLGAEKNRIFVRWTYNKYRQWTKERIEAIKDVDPRVKVCAIYNKWAQHWMHPVDIEDIAQQWDMALSDTYFGPWLGNPLIYHRDSFPVKLISDVFRARGKEYWHIGQCHKQMDSSYPHPYDILAITRNQVLSGLNMIVWWPYDFHVPDEYKVTEPHAKPKDLAPLYLSLPVKGGIRGESGIFAKYDLAYHGEDRWRTARWICSILSGRTIPPRPQPEVAILYPYDTAQMYPQPDLIWRFAHSLFLESEIHYDFITDNQIEREIRDLKIYKLLYIPRLLDERDSVVEKIISWVKEGGVLISSDPHIFYNLQKGKKLREELFGVEGIKPHCSREIILNKKIGTLEAGSRLATHTGMKIVPSRNASSLASWPDGSPAIITQGYGRGRTIYLGLQPLNMWDKEKIDSGWIEFFKGILEMTGINTKEEYYKAIRKELPELWLVKPEYPKIVEEKGGDNWWNPGGQGSPRWGRRKAIVLSNPLNVERIEEPLTIDLEVLMLPRNVYMNSLRLIDSKGREIPYQIDDIDHQVGPSFQDELSFLAELAPKEQKTYYLYYSTEKGFPKPNYLTDLEVNLKEDEVVLGNSKLKAIIRKTKEGYRLTKLNRNGLRQIGDEGIRVSFEDNFNQKAHENKGSPVEARVITSGPIRAKVQLVTRTNNSQNSNTFFEETYELWSKQEEIKWHLSISNAQVKSQYITSMRASYAGRAEIVIDFTPGGKPLTKDTKWMARLHDGSIAEKDFNIDSYTITPRVRSVGGSWPAFRQPTWFSICDSETQTGLQVILDTYSRYKNITMTPEGSIIHLEYARPPAGGSHSFGLTLRLCGDSLDNMKKYFKLYTNPIERPLTPWQQLNRHAKQVIATHEYSNLDRRLLKLIEVSEME